MLRTTSLPVCEELKVVVDGALTQNLRAIKVIVDQKRPRLIVGDVVSATGSLTKDLEGVGDVLSDQEPCVVMIRLADTDNTIPDIGDTWALVNWSPEAAPLSLKVRADTLLKSIDETFATMTLKQMVLTSKADADVGKMILMHSKAGMSEQKRQEGTHRLKLQKTLSLVEENFDNFRSKSGLAALRVEPLNSFKQSLGILLTEEKGSLLARVTGENSNQLEGTVLHFVTEAKHLVGNLPADEACYVVLIQNLAEAQTQAGAGADAGAANAEEEQEEKKMILLVWLPDGCPARTRVLASTNKVSALQLLKIAAKDYDLYQVEVHQEDDLTKELNLQDAELEAEFVEALPSIGQPEAIKKTMSRKNRKVPRMTLKRLSKRQGCMGVSASTPGGMSALQATSPDSPPMRASAQAA